MVGAALEVHEFEEEGGPLDAVVVGLADLEAAIPGEHERLLHGFDGLQFLGREVRTRAAHVFEDQPAEGPALGLVEFGRRDALVLDDAVGALLVAGEDVLEGVLGEEGLLALFRGQRLGEFATQVVLELQQLETDGAGLAFLDLARVAREERRGGAHQLAVDQREVEGEVVAFPAEAPGALGVGRPEDRHEVVLGVAQGAGAFLQLEQHLFEGHDRLGLHVAAAAQGDGEDGLRKVALARIHGLERETLAGGRHEDPVRPLGVVELEGRLGFLLGRKRAEEGLGGGGELLAGGMGEGGGQGERQQAERREGAGEGTHGGQVRTGV